MPNWMLLILLLIYNFNPAFAAINCSKVHRTEQIEQLLPSIASYNQVLSIMKMKPYSIESLPVIPLQMWKWFGNRLSFFVAKRSFEIIQKSKDDSPRDFREIGMDKPIHPMGVGLEGTLHINPTRWSGLFSGGTFPVLARASLSQGNPFKQKSNGDLQVRSTALAIKVFGTNDLDKKVKTINTVFQNDLNGLLGPEGAVPVSGRTGALNYLDSAQTNMPSLDFTKIRESYEVLTLVGVALGAFKTPKDRTKSAPFVNPQIRPVHSMAEFGIIDPEQVRTPTYIKIKPVLNDRPVEDSDFRLEIAKTLERDKKIVYEIYLADKKDGHGKIIWEQVGNLTFTNAILSQSIDQNLLFPHDRLNSDFTGKPFELPENQNQYNSVPDDVQ
jgi:hypothetical protein